MRIEYEEIGAKSGNLVIPSIYQLIINGTNVDTTLTNTNVTVETLLPEGRRMFSNDLNNVSPLARDGDLFISKRMKSREINVAVRITAKDFTDFKVTYAALNKLLYNTTYIKFSDETLTYYCKFNGASEPVENLLVQEIELSFYCNDPFKYSDAKTITYANSSTLTIETDYPVKPNLEITFGANTKGYSVRNTTTGKTITYNDSGTGTIVYNMDLLDNTFTKGLAKTDAFVDLLLNSNWEDFTIDKGQQLVVTPAPSSIKITYRGRYL